MKIAAIEDPGSRHEEQASFLMTASAADFMASMFWLLSKTAHLVDAALVSPKQQGGFA
jgi:hypothetical protein